MDTMSISEFKARCLATLERVRSTGRPLVVTRRGKPVATISPPPVERRKSAFGSMKGTIEILGDIIEPLDEPWEVLS